MVQTAVEKLTPLLKPFYDDHAGNKWGKGRQKSAEEEEAEQRRLHFEVPNTRHL